MLLTIPSSILKFQDLLQVMAHRENYGRCMAHWRKMREFGAISIGFILKLIAFHINAMHLKLIYGFSSIQSLSRVQLFATPWNSYYMA